MITNLFSNAAVRLRQSAFVVWIFIVFVAMFGVSLATGFEDLYTSFQGYLSLPTIKGHAWVPYLVALLPWLIQVGFGYIFLSDTAKRWALTGAILCHIVDVGTDIAFKIGVGRPGFVFDPVVFALALIESEVIFTLGSEVLMSVSFGMVVALWPDFLKQIGKARAGKTLGQLLLGFFYAPPKKSRGASAAPEDEDAEDLRETGPAPQRVMGTPYGQSMRRPGA